MKLLTHLVALCAVMFVNWEVVAGPIVDEAAKAEALVKERKDVDALIQMDVAVAKLWDELPLTFIEAMFVAKKPTSYGSYDPRPNNVFKAGEDMIIYMEMAGYEYGKDGDHFIIKMDASMEVKDAAGKVLGGQKNFLELGLRSRVPNREYFGVIVYNFSGIAPGKYTVTTFIKDHNTTDGPSSFDLPFEIK